MSLDLAHGRQPDHPVDAQFPARWSPRSFTDHALTEAEVLTVLEAARWAPSASNNQPTRFVWGLRGDVGFAAILGALVPSNRDWAQHAAALVVVASRDVTVAADGKVNPNRWSAFDAGAAWMSLALQVQTMGLAAHAMGGFDAPALSAAVALPDAHSLHAVVAIGQKGPADKLPEPFRARETPNQRNPLTTSAFRGRF